MNYTTWNYAYTFIDTIVCPKYYTEKAALTISTLYASTIYINSAHLTTLMRNDTEIVKMDYMSDDILLKKGGPANNEILYTSSDGNIVTPYNTSALPTIVSNTYVKGKGVIKFETDVTIIGKDAFKVCTSLTSVVFGNGLDTIGNSAFAMCYGLLLVIIPNSVSSIGNNTFSGCNHLTSISYTGTITHWNNITKGLGWNAGVPATVVHCTDGDAPI